MKYCNSIIFILVTAMGFSACSKNTKGATTVIDCNATQGITPTLYTPMLSGDTLIKLSTKTIINTYQNSNGTKTVCTQEGISQLIKK